MKLPAACLLLVMLATTALLAEGEKEVSFADLVEKPSDYEGKSVRLYCSLLVTGSESLAVAAVKEEEGELSFEGKAILLKHLKSSVKKELARSRYNKKTAYHGSASIIGVVETGEFGKKKEYRIQIDVASIEVAGGASDEFKVLDKNVRNKDDLVPEEDIGRARQAVKRDGFDPPTNPDYHDGAGLADSTQILCITDGRESKVYTIGSMGTCELVNDTIGKVPVAVTW